MLLLLFQGAASPDVTVALAGQAVTASAGTLVPSTSVALSGQSITANAGTLTASTAYTAALSGQSATASAGTLVASTASALTSQAVTATAGTVVATRTVPISGQGVTGSTGTLAGAIALALSGQASTVSAGTLGSLAAYTAALSGQAVTATAGSLLPATSVVLAGQDITATGGTLGTQVEGTLTIALTGSEVTTYAGTLGATSTEAVAPDKAGGDDAPSRGHRGYGAKRATLKRDREQEFTAQVRDIYRTLMGDPRTVERAEEIVARVEPATPVRGESEAAYEAAAMARAESLRRRADALDMEAIHAEIALRLLYQELRELQEAEDIDVLNMLLPMMVGLNASPVVEARQQIARELWDDEYDAEAIEILLAHVL